MQRCHRRKESVKNPRKLHKKLSPYYLWTSIFYDLIAKGSMSMFPIAAWYFREVGFDDRREAGLNLGLRLGTEELLAWLGDDASAITFLVELDLDCWCDGFKLSCDGPNDVDVVGVPVLALRRWILLILFVSSLLSRGCVSPVVNFEAATLGRVVTGDKETLVLRWRWVLPTDDEVLFGDECIFRDVDTQRSLLGRRCCCSCSTCRAPFSLFVDGELKCLSDFDFPGRELVEIDL